MLGLTRSVEAKHDGIAYSISPFQRIEIPFIRLISLVQVHITKSNTDCVGAMTEYTHFPFGISSLDSIIGEYLFEFESVFRQCDIVGLGVPFAKTAEFMAVSQLSRGQSCMDSKTKLDILDKESTAV